MNLLWFLLVGLIAGSLANVIMERSSKGLGSSLILGVVGAFVGGTLLGLLGVYTAGFVGRIISATIGAVVLIWVVRWFKGR